MNNPFLYNPTFEKYKSIIGTLEVNQNCEINLFVTKTYNIYDLYIIFYDENGNVLKNKMYVKDFDELYNNYFTVISFSKPYLYWYYFEFYDCYGKHYLGALDNLDIYLTDANVNSYQINVVNKNSDLSWFKGKIMYQIMVDRFNRSNVDENNYQNYVYHNNWNDIPNYKPVNGKILNNDFFGGNFQGIIEKIPYLKSLNVSIIYLNPIFLSPSNHKYNTSDYLTIDPMFGDINKFIELLEKLNKAGIDVILDGVFNHTGDDSIYFNKYNRFKELGAYQSKDSKYFDWYKFIKYPTKYKSWWGIDTLPTVNQDSSFTNFITEKVIDKWMSFGIKGFRLDVVDELNEAFLKQITRKIKSFGKDNIVIGEVWEDASNKIAYNTRKHYFEGNQLDSVMNYPLKNAIVDYLKNNNGIGLVNTIRHLINNYPKNVLDCLMNILSTHDTTRIISEFSNVNFHTLSLDERASYQMNITDYYNARSKLKLAVILLYTLPGIPSIYYGDETGLEGYKDPFCRKTMPWDNIDKEIFEFYKIMGNIRKESVFVDGIYHELFLDNNVFGYARKNNQNEIIVIINNTNYDYNYRITAALEMISNRNIIDYIIIKPQTGVILKR